MAWLEAKEGRACGLGLTGCQSQRNLALRLYVGGDMRWFVGVVALGLLLTACSGHSGNGSASPTAIATPSSTAEPSVFRSVASPLTKSSHAPNELLDVDYGVAFMNATNGSIELWSLAAAPAADEWAWLQPSRDGRLLVLQAGRDPVHWYVVRRDSGEAYEITGGWNLDISVGYENVIGAWNGLDAARFVLLDVARQAVLSTDIDRSRLGESSRVSRPDGKMFVVGDGSEFRLVDATTGASRVIKDGLTGYRAEPLGGTGFVLRPYSGADQVLLFDWDGIQRIPRADLSYGRLSPDGTRQAIEQSPGRIQGFGMGGFPVIGAVTIVNSANNQPVVRFLGASFGGWSADSKTLMLGDDQGGWSVIGLDGKHWTSLPYPGLTQGGPSFSPVDGALIATNRGIVNFKSGATWITSLKPQMSSASRWSTDGSEVVIWIQPTPGKDGGVAEQLLTMQYQAAPFDAPLPLAVKTPGDCLNLREAPRTDAAVVTCLRDSSRLILSTVPLPSPNPKMPDEEYIGTRDEQGRTWLHVTTTDGLNGWVDSAYVGWSS